MNNKTGKWNQKRVAQGVIFAMTFIMVQIALPISAKVSPTQDRAVVSYETNKDIVHPVVAQKGMVSTADSYATDVGLTVLQQGGNAVDAAIAIGFALSVTYPQAGNLGGGGFMLIKKPDGTVTSIDFREVAPKAASRDMYLDESKNVNRSLSLVSALASGVPGTVAGLDYARVHYGSWSLDKLVLPAQRLATEGIIVNSNLARALDVYGREVLTKHGNSKAIFFKEDGEPWQKGELFIQKELANSLALIAKEGINAFYTGIIAQQIVAEMKRQKGLITFEDLANYEVIEREPVMGTYRGFDIYSMPVPSSGGIHIIQILNILENFDLKSAGHNSAEAIHLMAEAMKYAYADRSEYLGDPAFVSVPTKQLIDKKYALSLAQKIDPEKTTPSQAIKPGDLNSKESDQTTHYSVVDQSGMAVAVTYTLNTNFGSGIVAGESGILLNNEMDDFSVKPGVANVYGLIGGEANSIAPGKRPLSSMSPTIVTRGKELVLVTGSPGGSRIITTVLQVVLNILEFDMNIAEASYAPRVHHQWYPEILRVEKGISIDTLKLLEAKGHTVKEEATMGSTQSILFSDNALYGAADPRTRDALAKGY